MRKLVPVAILVIAAVSATAVVAAARPATHRASRTNATSSTLVAQLAVAREATERYVGNLTLAKREGYQIITKMIPNMGYHFLNPKVQGFNLRKPPILVYEHTGSKWQLGALEWVYTAKPARAPFPGAKYGSFGAGCHYKDGSFVPAEAQSGCPATAPGSGAAFSFWHPVLITLHVWLWYPNPGGLFASTNPLVAAYNKG